MRYRFYFFLKIFAPIRIAPVIAIFFAPYCIAPSNNRDSRTDVDSFPVAPTRRLPPYLYFSIAPRGLSRRQFKNSLYLKGLSHLVRPEKTEKK